jgi:hypothetical protein
MPIEELITGKRAEPFHSLLGRPRFVPPITRSPPFLPRYKRSTFMVIKLLAGLFKPLL